MEMKRSAMSFRMRILVGRMSSMAATALKGDSELQFNVIILGELGGGRLGSFH
jgi:hypothetical protein